MRTTYRVFAYLIAALVAFQAAMIAFGIFGFGKWIDSGGVMDKAALESGRSNFGEEVGLMIHGIDGEMVIPVVALIFLIISFFAKVPKGAAWAGGVAGLIVVQVLLGIFGHALTFLGLLHGANALLLFTVALLAGLRAKAPQATPEPAPAAADRAMV